MPSNMDLFGNPGECDSMASGNSDQTGSTTTRKEGPRIQTVEFFLRFHKLFQKFLVLVFLFLKLRKIGSGIGHRAVGPCRDRSTEARIAGDNPRMLVLSMLQVIARTMKGAYHPPPF